MSIRKISAAVLLFTITATGQGRRTIPNATPEQTAAIANITAALALPVQRLAMGIMAFRGQVVEGAGLGAKRLMATIGDRTTLGSLVKMKV